MAASDKTVKVTVTANVVPYKKGMAEASTATQKLGSDMKDVEKRSKGLEGSMGAASGAIKGLALGGAALAGAGIVSFLSDSVKAAGDLQQSIGGVDSVFKDSAQTVHDFGQTSAQSVGLSTNAFNELVTVTGAMLKNKGLEDFTQKSLDLVKVGADLSAQFGGSTKDAVDALNAAMRGESDPIERYGISLNQAAVQAELAKKGLTGLTGAALDQATAQARIDIITRQASDAMGAFARESDTLQGSQQRLNAEWENAQAQLGQALLPALTKITEALRAGLDIATSVAGVWDKIPGPVKAAAAALVLFRIAQTRLAGVGRGVVGTVRSLGEAIGFARQSAERAGGGLTGLAAGLRTFTGSSGIAKGAMKGLQGAGSALMGLAGGPWGAAIGGLTAAITLYAQANAEAQADVDALTETLDKQSGAFTEATRQFVGKNFAFNVSKEDIDRLQQMGVGMSEVTDAALGTDKQFEQMRQRLTEIANGNSDATQSASGLLSALDNMREKALGAKDQLEVTGKFVKETGDAAGKAAPNVDTFAIKTALAGENAADAVKAHKDLAQAILDISDAAVSADQAESAWQQAIDDATKAIDENGKTANKSRTALNLNTQAGRDNQAALVDLRDAAIDNAKAMLDQGDSSDTVKDKMDKARDAFIKAAEKMGLNKTAAGKLADQYGLTRDSVDKLNASMEKTPKQVKVSIQVSDAAAKTAIKGIDAMLKAIDRDRTINVTVKRLGVDRGDFVGGSGGTHAAGGYIGGPGSATSDSIPAWLSNGEYVIKAAAVAKYGTRLFDQMNSMRFATGGFVSRMPAASASGVGIDYGSLAAAIAPLLRPVQINTPAPVSETAMSRAMAWEIAR